MKRVCFRLTFLVWALAIAPAQAASVEISIGGWRQDPNGILSIMALNRSIDFDMQDDLGFDPEWRLFGRLNLITPSFFPNINIVAAPAEFEADDEAVTLDLNGGLAANIDSKVILNQYDLALYYGIPGLRTATLGKLNIDIGINARWIEFSTDISAESTEVPGGRITKEEDVSIVVPMLYSALQFKPTERFSFEAEARGLSIGTNSLYSLIGRIRYKLIGPAFVAAGYRFDKIDIDEGDIRLDDEISGPFVEFGLKF